MQMPKTIEVLPEAVDLSNDWVGNRTPVWTSLFREESRLDTVIDLGLQNHESRQIDEPLHMVSVGCSFGAEVDSALAYVSFRKPDLKPLTIVGIDVNDDALRGAAQGRYRISTATPAWARESLETYGFTLEEDMDQGTLVVCADKLRADHNVTFVEADMRVGRGIEPQDADVVFCNNVLYHHCPEDAEGIVYNLVKQLVPGGVMGWEFNSGADFAMRGSDVEYTNWRIETGRKLAALGVVPIALNNRGAPYIFQSEK